MSVLKEARTLKQVEHPHLVRVVDFFELNDTAYLVMDYYEGEDLARHLKLSRKGQPGIRLPWRQAVQLMLPVLDGLQKVHEAGFMHRDIKPGNLYLTRKDGLILLDFGAAREVASDHAYSKAIYTEGYAPYEQCLHSEMKRQGSWTDVYGVAATLYVMLTGQRLPSGLERRDAIQSKRSDPLQPARRIVPDLPPALDVVLGRALKVEPEQRLQTVLELTQQLEGVLAEEAKKPPNTPQKSPRKFYPLAAAIALLLVILLWGG